MNRRLILIRIIDRALFAVGILAPFRTDADHLLSIFFSGCSAAAIYRPRSPSVRSIG